MSEIVPQNVRIEGSRITDSRILMPGDALRFVGLGSVALIEVLDSHDPYDDGQRPLEGLARIYSMMEGLNPDVPAPHHHVLAKLESEPFVVSTGLRLGAGRPAELFMPHISRLQYNDLRFRERVFQVQTFLTSGSLALYYASDQAKLSSLPEGRELINEQGGLKLY